MPAPLLGGVGGGLVHGWHRRRFISGLDDIAGRTKSHNLNKPRMFGRPSRQAYTAYPEQGCTLCNGWSNKSPAPKKPDRGSTPGNPPQESKRRVQAHPHTQIHDALDLVS